MQSTFQFIIPVKPHVSDAQFLSHKKRIGSWLDICDLLGRCINFSCVGDAMSCLLVAYITLRFERRFEGWI